jgi:hypothetical protein
MNEVITPLDYYEKIFKKMNIKKNISINELINYICEEKSARDICGLTSKNLPDNYPHLKLNEFEKKSFEKKYKEKIKKDIHDKKEYELIESSLELEDLSIEELFTDYLKNNNKKNNNEIIINNHLKKIKDVNKLNLQLNLLNINNQKILNKIEKEIHFYLINMFEDMINNITFLPKFYLDYFNNKYINFLYDRKHNINDYKNLNDFFENYVGEAAMDAETYKWKNLTFKDVYEKQIRSIIEKILNKESEIYIKDISIHIFNLISEMKIEYLFEVYNIKENKEKYKTTLKNSEEEVNTENVIEEFLNNIKNINNKSFLLFVDGEEDYIPPSEKDFNMYEYEFFKEIRNNDMDKFKSNILNYYCDVHNINLFIILEETNIILEEKKVMKLSSFYLYNKNIVKINKKDIDISILPNKLQKDYKIIIKD